METKNVVMETKNVVMETKIVHQKLFRMGKYLILHLDIDGLVQERCNSIAIALELQLSCTNSWICFDCFVCAYMAIVFDSRYFWNFLHFGIL